MKEWVGSTSLQINFVTTKGKLVDHLSMLANKSVVICEDDADMLESICELLSDFGAQVDKYDNAGLALERIRQRPPDVILSDISMPEMNGFEFLDALNSMGVQVPLIFLTGNADIDSYRRGLVRGHFEFLTKPLVPDALLQAISKALQFTQDSLPGKIREKLSSLETRKS